MVLLVPAAVCVGQGSEVPEMKSVNRAIELQSAGRYNDVIAILSSIDFAVIVPSSLRGQMLTMLAFDCQTAGRFDRARSLFERAILLLKAENRGSSDYAIALRSLANLDGDEGLFQDAIRLDSEAADIYRGLGNHAGTVETLVAIASKEFKLRHWKAATKDLGVAEMTGNKYPSELNDDTRSEVYTLKGLIDARHGDSERAIQELQRAVEFRRASHGEHHLATGLAYVQLGAVEGRKGQTWPGLRDLDKGVQILSITVGEHSPKYLGASVVYAELLHKLGCNTEARRLRSRAQAELRLIFTRECESCRVSAAGFQ